jgi:hydroxymethylpyrimidine pyrophosphatase-like HAD family hydrolase
MMNIGTIKINNRCIHVKLVLTSLQKQGHYLMIATGRPYRASQIYYHELNMNTPIVNFNGAYVFVRKLKLFLYNH